MKVEHWLSGQLGHIKSYNLKINCIVFIEILLILNLEDNFCSCQCKLLVFISRVSIENVFVRVTLFFNNHKGNKNLLQ